MKVDDLVGPLLDYWMGRAMGLKEHLVLDEEGCWFVPAAGSPIKTPYNISIDAVKLFDAISTRDIYVIPEGKYVSGSRLRTYNASMRGRRLSGPTLGEAVCKALIHEVFGDNTPD